MQNRTQKGKTALDIHLFGAFRCAGADGRQVSLKGRKDRAVLAYLAAHPGQVVARDRLVELIWPNSVATGGRASLRQALSVIRKELPAYASDLIIAERDTVTLNTARFFTDSDYIETVLSQPGKRSEVEYKFDGTFLDDLTGISTEFDAWRGSEEARQVALASRYFSNQAGLARRDGQFAEATALLSQAVKLDPFAESIGRDLMRAHSAMGRPDAALRYFSSLEVLLETELGVRPERETQELAREIRAQRNTNDRSAPPSPPKESELGAKLQQPAVLVAPFLEGDQAPDYFASSFTESVILALARFYETPVLDLKSVHIASSVHSDNLTDMGRAVGSRYVLSGAIRRLGSRLRVNARLTEVGSGRTVWAEKFDREMGDIMDIEDEISAHVAAAIAGKIEFEDQRRARLKKTTDLGLIDLIMRGRYHLNQYTKAGEDAAKQNFNEALKRNPDCVPALAGLATSHIHDFESGSTVDPEANLKIAQGLAERAISLDEDDAHARYALASAMYYQGGSQLAIEHCNRALDINPNDYHNLCSQGWFLTFSGEVKKGLECNARAISLNPYAPNGCLMVAGFGKIIESDFKGAVQTLLAIRSENMFKQGGLAACYKSLNRNQDAQLAAKTFRELAEQDFPGDAETGFSRTREYWRRMFCFANPEDGERFFGALNSANVPV